MESASTGNFNTNTSKMCADDSVKSSLSEVLQSDLVKRLLNQPNIVVRAVPFGTSVRNSTSTNSIITDKKNGMNKDLSKRARPDISIVPVKMRDEINEDANLLPSKNEGKSEIALLPIKRERKPCGHYEPCENIVCDVAVQQYADHEGVSPMLAVNITEEEINAPVSKHCRNEGCDALSIDHNRCRRALIKLYRCNKSNACDICGIPLKTPKSRIRHRYCTRKEEYRHNEVDSSEVLKERMRQRELQLLEAAKMKRNDYLDPVTGYTLTMETLRKNDELIIIPKTAPSVPTTCSQPVITITSVSNNQTDQQTNNATSAIEKSLSNVPIVLSQGNMMINNKSQKDENQSTSTKQTNASDPVVTAFVTIPTVTPVSTSFNLPQNQYIRLANVPQPNVQTYIQGNVQPVNLNNWLVSQPQVITTIQPKPFLTPIRVVPITNLITQPSLLHQTQGIPKFCIMADNVISPVAVTNPQPARPTRPIQPASNVDSTTTTVSDVKVATPRKRRRFMYKKGGGKKKDFVCNYCSKHFSTDWYFRMHVAKHQGKKLFKCKICDMPFSDWYQKRKHIYTHENISCKRCNKVCLTYASFEKHMKHHRQVDLRGYKCEDCDARYSCTTSLTAHRRRVHGKEECKVCHEEFEKKELNEHMASHGETDSEMIQTNDEQCDDDNSSSDVEKQDAEEANHCNGVKMEIEDSKIDSTEELEDMEEIKDKLKEELSNEARESVTKNGSVFNDIGKNMKIDEVENSAKLDIKNEPCINEA